MSYFPIGHRDEVDDFSNYDPTPYGGGYDIALTYGRTLPPSYDICYPNTSSASNFFNYDRPQYTSHAEPSAYANEALDNEYRSYARPKTRPSPPTSAGGYGYDGPKPNYGFQPGGGVSEYGGRAEYGSMHGSEYGRKPELENPGAGYGRKPEYGGPGYGPGVYGRRPESAEFQPSYGRKPGSEFGETNNESGGYGYGGRPDRNEYGQEKENPSYAMPNYTAPGYPYPSYPEPSYPIPSYPEPSYPIPSYPEPSYERPRYGRSGEEDYRKPSYERRHHNDDNEGHGRKKYGDDSSDVDRRRHHHHDDDHHHHKHYDD